MVTKIISWIWWHLPWLTWQHINSWLLEYLYYCNPTLLMTKTSWLHEYWQSLIHTEVAVQGKISTSISKMNSNIFNKTHYNIAKLSTVCADGHMIIWVINSMTEQRVFVETVASLLQTLSANPNKYPQHGSEHHGIPVPNTLQ